MNGLIEAISNLFNGNDILATIVMSMVPLIELKGGIVFAFSSLGLIKAFLFSYLGSTAVFFVVFFLLKPILNLLKKIKGFNNFTLKIENYFENKANEINEKSQKENIILKNKDRIKMLGVFLFVAIPLPMTGVYTGTAIAVFLNLKFRQAILPVVIGNFIAGILICLLSLLCNFIGIDLNIVLWVLFVLAIVILIITIIKVMKQKGNKEN